ncbi:MAG: ABC transporter substrate-binding protein [Candidatus Hodarchaeales archaeon]
MKKTKTFLMLSLTAAMILAVFTVLPQTSAAPEQLPNFEIVMPWGTDHERGKIIKSMIENETTISAKYNFTFTAVGGGPSDRDALTARFLAGDYPNLILCTQDWYTEFSEYGIWENFAPNVAAWSGGRAGWVADIPDGWWSILDLDSGDGTGDNIYALPFFGQSVIPYVNTDHFTKAGLDPDTDLDTVAEWLTACDTLATTGFTPFAMVGTQISDIAYMNYMLGSTDNYINSRSNPATVYPWDTAGDYGVNGTLSVEGFAAYLKMKGEGWVVSTVDATDGGGANTLFGQNKTSMVFCGPWGTSIFENTAKDYNITLNFKAVPMPASSDGVRSTITGGGISFVPKAQTAAVKADAMALAEWLLEDANQMKTVDNWLNAAWRIPVRESLKSEAWFTAHPNRTNFVTHIESQVYAFPWGRQHPKWVSIHESVMMPGYHTALGKITWNGTYTDDNYTDAAQAALDAMALEIETNYLPNIPTTTPGTTVILTSEVIVTSQVTQIVTEIVTSVVQASGFGIIVSLVGVSSFYFFFKKRKK